MRALHIQKALHTRVVNLLKACAEKKDLCRGARVHSSIQKLGLLHKSPRIGSALISLYAKCGVFAEAQRVLHELPVRDVVCWNALIGGYAQQGQGKEALHCFKQMQEDQFSPNAVTFICTLKACGSIQAIAMGEKIHDEIVNQGLLGDNIVLGNAVVDMYSQCGFLAKAHQLMDELPVRNVISWNELITGYVQNEKGNEALNCFEQMQHENILPDCVTFACILKACGIVGNIEKGKEIHGKITCQGLLENNPLLGTALVDMYAKCTALLEAHHSLYEFAIRNAISWNALISGYAKLGQVDEVLNCFKQMQCEGITPDEITFMCILRACGIVGAIDKGKFVHDKIAQQGLLVKYGMLGNALVDMYVKCGDLAKAQEVLDNLSVRSVVSWSALITGYTNGGKGAEALLCFEWMQQEGLSPNEVTYVSVLKACSSIGAVHKGEQIHSDILCWGLLKESFVLGTAVVDMYAQCGAFTMAREVFDQLAIHDAISWNALIAAYAQQEQGEEALKCFEKMKYEGIAPNVVTFTCILKACSSIKALDKGKQVHNDIVSLGLAISVELGSAVVDMYVKCGALVKAQEVLTGLPNRDVVAWNVIIASYIQEEQCQEALLCYEQMQNEGICPNVITFICLLKACASLGVVIKGKQIHDDIIHGEFFEEHNVLGSALVDMYSKCGALIQAQQVFDKVLIPNTACWNTLIAGYIYQVHSKEALNCYEQMQSKVCIPDAITFVYTLKACGNIGAAEKGKQIHNELVKQGLPGREFVLGTTLVDMYSKCGWLVEAAHILDNLPVRNAISWNSLIAGYAQQVQSKEALNCFECMQCEGLPPDAVTFSNLLNIFSRLSLVEKGRIWLGNMNRKHGILPDTGHYTCIVDLLGRSGNIDKAIALIERMPFPDDPAVWSALLGACGKWGNMRVGKWAFCGGVQADEKGSAACVDMPTMYVAAGLHKADDSNIHLVCTCTTLTSFALAKQ